MKSLPRHAMPQEIELKLSLPGADPAGLAVHLARIPLLARRKPIRQALYNIYIDTPDQLLRHQRAALRLRRVGSAAQPQWLQTLKTGASDDSALSRRGEWETAVAGPALSRDALNGTAWAAMDTDGSLFDRLMPCFVTQFERTTWLVRRRDGSVVEVALDIGQIEADGRQAPICELELELKAGQSAALFDIARVIAQVMAVLPANQSKAQRGFLLAQRGLDQPQRAQPPRLNPDLAGVELAQCVLLERFAQFTTNLNVLGISDDPEVVHQARVGWRRFKSALRLFCKLPALASAPAWPELNALLSGLSELRNREVALTETLPPLEGAYCRGEARRAEAWQAALTTLAEAVALQRQVVRHALQDPAVGSNLLLMTQWLHDLAQTQHSGPEDKGEFRQWAKRRVLRLQQRLHGAQKNAPTPQQQHRVRILAKRLRYGAEALQDLLPKRLARLCGEQAAAIQTSIGATRDISQASALATAFELNAGIVEFLRGVELGLSLK